jgi:hypothetical protein
MFKLRVTVPTILILLMSVSILYAQADCPVFVQNTLESVTEICSDTGRDEACYGNNAIQASGRSSDFQFSTPGDLTSVGNIETLRLSNLSIGDEQWGIALMNVRANLPDASTANATILLFGDVTVANVGRTTVDIPATADNDIDIFLRPNDPTIVATLATGDSLTADGRLEDSSWIRLRLAEGGYGWVTRDAVLLDGEANNLIIIAPEQPFYGPMQAFYVETGADAPPCTEAPPSGILIQTPEGVGEISLLINEVDIRLGSTAFIQQSGGTMIFCILEGQGEVTSGGVTRVIPEGGYTTLAIADLRPAGELTPLEGYGPASGLAALPTQLLPRPITIAEGLTEGQIRELQGEPVPTQDTGSSDNGIQPSQLVPQAGTWQVTGDIAICRELESGTIAAHSSDLIFGTGTLTVSADGSSFTFESPNGTSTHTLNAPGQYFLSIGSTDDGGTVENYFTAVTSSTTMTTTLSVATTAICNAVDGTAMWTFVG